MAPALRRQCQLEGCNYVTVEGLATQDAVLKDLELHLEFHKLNLRKTESVVAVEKKKKNVAEKLVRPIIDEHASESDWEFFLMKWKIYVAAAGLEDQELVFQLWNCPTDVLQRQMHDLGYKVTSSEDDLLQAIKKLAVKKHNNVVKVIEFLSVIQTEGENISSLSSRISGKARLCDFTIVCTNLCEQCETNCGGKIDFTSRMEAFQMIRSLLDAEMQEKILGETLERDLTFEEIVKLAQNIESAKLSSGLIMKTGPEANKISEENTKTPEYERCGHCGSRHQGDGGQESREKFCWAWKLSCNKCGTKGHIAKVCKSKNTRNNVIEDVEDPKGEADEIAFRLFSIEEERETESLERSVSTNVASAELDLEIKNRRCNYPDYPMKSLYCGKTHVGNYTYFVLIDRFSNWPSVCQTSRGGAEDLILFLSRHFKNFGVPDSITNDGGQVFASYKVKSFLKKWNVKQRLSSECDPSALTTAKLGIELIKCTLRCYTTKSGFLNCDGFSRAITRYRNTPCGDIGVSPSNILLGRDLEEQLPAATDVSKVRKQAMAGSLPNLNVGIMAGNFAEFESNLSNGTQSLPDLSYEEDRGANVRRPTRLVDRGADVRRSTCLVERCGKSDGGGNLTRVNRRFPTLAKKVEIDGGDERKGGDGRKGGDRRVEDGRKGGDRRWRRYNW